MHDSRHIIVSVPYNVLYAFTIALFGHRWAEKIPQAFPYVVAITISLSTNKHIIPYPQVVHICQNMYQNLWLKDFLNKNKDDD